MPIDLDQAAADPGAAATAFAEILREDAGRGTLRLDGGDQLLIARARRPRGIRLRRRLGDSTDRAPG